MKDAKPEVRTVIVEREFPHPPEKIWRALTQPHLIEEWLMQNDFKPLVGGEFTLHAEWGTVDCKVLEIDQNRVLSYTWVAMGLESVITWTLAPVGAGTLLKMEHTGFGPEQEQAYCGAKVGWQTFFTKLDQVLSRAD